MAGVVKAMESAMRSMNLEKVSQLMDRFERDFENLDVQSAAMEGSMQATTTLNAPQSQVDGLMQQVADEAGYVSFVDTSLSLLHSCVSTSAQCAFADSNSTWSCRPVK